MYILNACVHTCACTCVCTIHIHVCTLQYGNIIDIVMSNTYILLTCDDSMYTFRGNSFRETYQRLGEIKSLIPPHVHVMALTATASNTTRNQVYRLLGMHLQHRSRVMSQIHACTLKGTHVCTH